MDDLLEISGKKTRLSGLLDNRFSRLDKNTQFDWLTDIRTNGIAMASCDKNEPKGHSDRIFIYVTIVGIAAVLHQPMVSLLKKSRTASQ